MPGETQRVRLFQDVVAIVTDTERDEAGINALETLCAGAGGHATALMTPPLPDVYYAGDGMSGASMWALVIKQLEEDAKKERTKLEARLKKAAHPIELRSTPLEFYLSRETAVMNARHASMTIFALPTETADRTFTHEVLESVLFQSGRPVLLAPPAFKRALAFKKVLVAWKPTREAARAVGDATEILAAADKVTVLTIDATPSTMGHGDAPGQDIAAHLARLGAKVEVRNEDSMGRSDGDCVLDVARSLGADLIVLGAYGHSRLRQFVFGGVTKRLLQNSDIPLLLSH